MKPPNIFITFFKIFSCQPTGAGATKSSGKSCHLSCDRCAWVALSWVDMCALAQKKSRVIRLFDLTN